MNTTKAKERPILMSGPMVRSIWNAEKKQTRRVIKNCPDPRESHGLEGGCCWSDWTPSKHADGKWYFDSTFASSVAIGACPYGEVGDHLWVREATIRAGAGACWFQADNSTVYGTDPLTQQRMPALWPNKNRSYRPPMHMPRDWCRILLEIKDVRVERLRSITPLDCLAEGIKRQEPVMHGGDAYGYAYKDFRELWQSINSKRPGCDWDSNPWVWALEFERIEP